MEIRSGIVRQHVWQSRYKIIALVLQQFGHLLNRFYAEAVWKNSCLSIFDSRVQSSLLLTNNLLLTTVRYFSTNSTVSFDELLNKLFRNGDSVSSTSLYDRMVRIGFLGLKQHIHWHIPKSNISFGKFRQHQYVKHGSTAGAYEQAVSRYVFFSICSSFSIIIQWFIPQHVTTLRGKYDQVLESLLPPYL